MVESITRKTFFSAFHEENGICSFRKLIKNYVVLLFLNFSLRSWKALFVFSDFILIKNAKKALCSLFPDLKISGVWNQSLRYSEKENKIKSEKYLKQKLLAPTRKKKITQVKHNT